MAGALVVAQSGGPTAVMNASLAGLVSAATGSGAFRRVLGLRHGILGALPGGGGAVELTSLSTAHLAALTRTPAAALGSCRRRVTDGECATILAWLRSVDAHAFAYIGGNDSMETCLRLSQIAEREGYDLAVVGIPKTIDNDLPETDHCPGYGSAARYWALAAQEAALDLAAMRGYDDIVVLECMGRNAGWLAAATVLGRLTPDAAPHLLLIPEVPVVLDHLLAHVETVLARTGYAVVVTAETVRDPAGQYLHAALGSTGTELPRDAFGHPVITGTAERLAEVIGRSLRRKARAIKPGTLQRAASTQVSAVDRQEAWAVGAAAARLLALGRSDIMVTIEAERTPRYRSWCSAVALERVASRERLLPPSFLHAFEPEGSGGDVASPFLSYARPLLGGPLPDFVRLI